MDADCTMWSLELQGKLDPDPRAPGPCGVVMAQDGMRLLGTSIFPEIIERLGEPVLA